MVFAELRYPGHYSDQHDAIVECLINIFTELQHGHQGDSWIWIGEGEDKVSIDTFYSMTHQIRASTRDTPLLAPVLDQLQLSFDIEIYREPQPDPYEH